MKNMNPIFSLKNFRSFGEDGADFELAPITILTGCNSAGKSSLVKALMLLSQATETTNGDFDEPFSLILKDIRGVDLLVSSKDLCLGNYTKILNKKSKDGLIELSYDVWSSLLKEKIRIIRIYKEDAKDTLQNGQLIALKILKADGTMIYGKGLGITKSNHHLLEDECFNRDCLQDAINQLDVLSLYYLKKGVYDDAMEKWELLQQRQDRYKELDNYDEIQNKTQKNYDLAKLDFEEARRKMEESNISKEDIAKIEKDYLKEKEESCSLKSLEM